MHRVVNVGGGFGGLYAARALKRADVDVIHVDRRNHHLLQPQLCEAAIGSLSPWAAPGPQNGHRHAGPTAAGSR